MRKALTLALLNPVFGGEPHTQLNDYQLDCISQLQFEHPEAEPNVLYSLLSVNGWDVDGVSALLSGDGTFGGVISRPVAVADRRDPAAAAATQSLRVRPAAAVSDYVPEIRHLTAEQKELMFILSQQYEIKSDAVMRICDAVGWDYDLALAAAHQLTDGGTGMIEAEQREAEEAAQIRREVAAAESEANRRLREEQEQELRLSRLEDERRMALAAAAASAPRAEEDAIVEADDEDVDDADESEISVRPHRSVPDEPAVGDSSAIQIRVRCPSSALNRRFRKTDTLADVYAWLYSVQPTERKWQLSTAYPPKFLDDSDESLEDAGVANSVLSAALVSDA